MLAKRPPTEMPPKMLELKLLCQGGNPGRAVTPEDIKAAPAKLRNTAMNAMVRSLSLDQKYNYKKCQTDRERRTWVVEYMRDPEKSKCGCVTKKARRSELLEGIAVAKERLSLVDAQLEMAKMRRTEICEEIGMKRNQLTLLDAQLEEENREPDHMRPIRRFSKLTIGRRFEAMLRRIEEP